MLDMRTLLGGERRHLSAGQRDLIAALYLLYLPENALGEPASCTQDRDAVRINRGERDGHQMNSPGSVIRCGRRPGSTALFHCAFFVPAVSASC
jgi:hypothetical protein